MPQAAQFGSSRSCENATGSSGGRPNKRSDPFSPIKIAAARCVDGFCSPIGRHSPLDFQGPAQFERKEKKMNQSHSAKVMQVQLPSA